MAGRCPECKSETVVVGYVLPDGFEEDFVRAYRARRAGSAGDAMIEAAERKTKMCLVCGFEPVGKDARGLPP